MLKELNKCKSLNDIARVLKTNPSKMSYLLYKMDKKFLYYSFDVTKKSGGTRKISKPTPALKKIQNTLRRVLQECEHEITKNNTTTHSYAFKKNLNIYQNAKAHTRKKFVINYDLENFFDSFNFGRVRGYFIHSNKFNMHPKAATILAQICCHNNGLPQGAPTSPILSNLIAHYYDIEISKIANKHKLNFTRYADDITLSSRAGSPSSSVAKRCGWLVKKYKIGKTIRIATKRHGFSINNKKFRIEFKNSRQTVTGLIVNSKVNINRDYYLKTRAMCHSLFTKGEYHGKSLKNHTNTQELEGRLSHIANIKGYNPESSHTKLIKRTLYYKTVFNPHYTTIVTEGKTDNIYLRQLLRMKGKAHHLKEGEGKNSVTLYKRSEGNYKVFNLPSGSDLVNFIPKHEENSKNFIRHNIPHACILFVDNDSGGNHIANSCKKYNQTIDFGNPKLWEHIIDNLYIMWCPKLEEMDTYMEQLFPPELLNATIEGKPFNPSNNYNPSQEYGKNDFAHKVILGKSKEGDFNKLEPILAAINQIKDDVKLRFA